MIGRGDAAARRQHQGGLRSARFHSGGRTGSRQDWRIEVWAPSDSHRRPEKARTGGPLAARVASFLLACSAAGCCYDGAEPPVPTCPFVPMHLAIARLNENNARLLRRDGGLKASPVTATGQFREPAGGSAMHFSLRGAMRFRPPRDLVLILREGLGGSAAMQAGSNAHEYWLWVQPRINTLWWGRYRPAAAGAGPASRPAEDMPLRPDHLIDVLGLRPLPTDTTGIEGPVYRPQAHRNVLMFLDYDSTGQGHIEKEFHLDCRPPHLIREIIFRRPDGRTQMYASLSGYKVVADSRGLAAHAIDIVWPAEEGPPARLALQIGRYTLETEAFEPQNPRDLGIEFNEVHQVDEPAATGPATQPAGIS